MTIIWYEVLPVTLVSEQAMLIRHQQEKRIPPWMIRNQPHIHPNSLVVNNLINFFGDAFDPDRTIVHSTSWRYEDESDRLLLTYLAVLPQGNWVKRWAAAGRISIERIETVEMQYGDHLSPPQQIEQPYVVAHALDHLASLSRYDPAIRAILEPEWQEVLRSRVPRSAGYLQVHPTEVSKPIFANSM